MIATIVHIFTFDELPDEAQRRAITEHRYFMLDTLRPDYIDGKTDWNDPEKMEMYNADYEHISDNDEPVIDNIKINGQLYFFDGMRCQSITYTGKHPKAGKTEITVHGETDSFFTEEIYK